MEHRGIAYALDYLKSFYPVMLFKDELHKRSGCSICVDALSRKLRKAAQDGKILAIPVEQENGTIYKKYQHNPNYIPHKRPVKALGPFFYSVPSCKEPSSLYPSIQAILDSFGYGLYGKACNIWSGDYSAPILMEVVK